MAILESKLKRNEAFERRTAHWRGEMARLRAEEEVLRLGGGAKAQDKQRAQGKMTARERVAALCDPGAPFLELGLWVAHGFYQEYGGAPAAEKLVSRGETVQVDVHSGAALLKLDGVAQSDGREGVPASCRYCHNARGIWSVYSFQARTAAPRPLGSPGSPRG